ncbi:NADH dehydrogenase [ubiquinone] 1 subunit C2 [Condylostylus longicornis]|uniref:NADH dehydrogenase [ubiquinone] 1 subunit C2 n=1 Tax=Condylostylus longicornis TaxID=2530218 RepID=UPI00244DC34B|nr:NADH dehydrogenase [ubiquinone] 1 subunit C2 [Condylostylus longicornis]
MTSPLELLENKNDRIPTFLNDKWNPMLGLAMGFGAACYMNFALRVPVFSGIQRHVSFALIGGLLGKYFDGKRNDYLAERDAVLRHYVQLHPEDFPTPERKKFADVLHQWAPIR